MILLLACTATLGVAPDPGEAATLPPSDVRWSAQTSNSGSFFPKSR